MRYATSCYHTIHWLTGSSSSRSFRRGPCRQHSCRRCSRRHRASFRTFSSFTSSGRSGRIGSEISSCGSRNSGISSSRSLYKLKQAKRGSEAHADCCPGNLVLIACLYHVSIFATSRDHNNTCSDSQQYRLCYACHPVIHQ